MWLRHVLHTPKGQERRGGQHKTTSASGTRTSWPSLACPSAHPSAWYGRPPMLTYYLPSSFSCPFRSPVPPPARPPTSRPPHTCPSPDPLVPATAHTFTPPPRILTPYRRAPVSPGNLLLQESVSKSKTSNQLNRMVNQINATASSSSSATGTTTTTAQAAVALTKFSGLGSTAERAKEKERPGEDPVREQDGRLNINVAVKMLK